MHLSRRRYAILTLAGLGIIMASVGIRRLWIVRYYFGHAPEDHVFDSIKVGDSEARLVDLLKRQQVDYSVSNEGRRTVYSHGGSLVGVCFYLIADGRVIAIAKD